MRAAPVLLLLALSVPLVSACGGGGPGRSGSTVFPSESAPAAATAVPPTSTATRPPTPTPRPAGAFTRMVIPEIRVSAPIERLGLTPENALETPHVTGDVGLYTPYDQPGKPGNSVWAGYNGTIFSQLNELRPQSEVFLETESGGRIRYLVIAKTRYPVATIPMADVIFPKLRPAAKEWLTLITSGDLDDKGNTLNYDVVAAERVD